MTRTLTMPEVQVADGEYKRLLGLPAEFEVDDQIKELMEWARCWYATHGRPWVASREVEIQPSGDAEMRIEGHMLRSHELLDRMRRTQARRAVLIAASAGPEAEEEASRLWLDEKPAEYFFLDVHASAVVESLVTSLGAQLCQVAEPEGLVVLPHYSPGYSGWELGDQKALAQLLTRGGREPFPGKLEVMESGMLSPKKSQLAIFGVALKEHVLGPLAGVVPCELCAHLKCQYRRAPYKRWQYHTGGSADAPLALPAAGQDPAAAPKSIAEYSFSVKALQKWSERHLQVRDLDDGGVEATFRFDGSTCSDSGIPLAYRFDVRFSPRASGHRILAMSCRAIEGEDGYRRQCSFKSGADQLEREIETEKPLLGKSWEEIPRWNPSVEPAACLCTQDHRNHKWKIALQTMHYGLARIAEQGDKEKRT